MHAHSSLPAGQHRPGPLLPHGTACPGSSVLTAPVPATPALEVTPSAAIGTPTQAGSSARARQQQLHTAPRSCCASPSPTAALAAGVGGTVPTGHKHGHPPDPPNQLCSPSCGAEVMPGDRDQPPPASHAQDGQGNSCPSSRHDPEWGVESGDHSLPSRGRQPRAGAPTAAPATLRQPQLLSPCLGGAPHTSPGPP